MAASEKAKSAAVKLWTCAAQRKPAKAVGERGGDMPAALAGAVGGPADEHDGKGGGEVGDGGVTVDLG